MRRRPFSQIRQKRSFALVITLAVLVLISALLILFFNQSLLNRQISFSSAGQYRADVLAHTAVDTITGDLRTQILAGSSLTNIVAGGVTTSLYLPTNNFTVEPYRVSDQGFNNLLAQSASTSNFWAGTNYSSGFTSPARSSTNNSTQTASANGRYISANRWNAPGLLGDLGTGSTPQLTNNSPATGNAYIPPDWVVITRQGPITNAVSYMPPVANLADKSPGNPNYAVGRYAYTIYNEGALLDANVVGYPNGAGGGTNSLSGTTFASERGVLPQVDLANLLTAINDANAASDANNLVNWRNQVSAASTNAYLNYLYSNSVTSATNGFTAVAASTSAVTDQSFSSRQDLINYIKYSSIPTGALQYLGTFTRDADGPSYYPNPNRPASPAGLAADNITNPNVLSIRVQTSFTRDSDNTPAVVGEPLLKHRFPLSRLALFANPSGSSISSSGATVTNAILIKKFFCMQQGTAGNGDAGLWDYVDPDSGTMMTTLPTIKTLAQVAALGTREPTFWELLQAGILNGSLGGVNTWSGTNYLAPIVPSGSTGLSYSITDQDGSLARHVLAIGLNIIDQYTPLVGSRPTPFVINLGGIAPAASTSTYFKTAITSGTPITPHILDNLFISSEENVPYISSLAINNFEDANPLNAVVNHSTGVRSSLVNSYLQFIMWNPHRATTTTPQAGFRIVCTGSTYITATNCALAFNSAYLPPTSSPTGTSASIDWGTTGTTAITFSSTNQTFNVPSALVPTNCVLGGCSPYGLFPCANGGGSTSTPLEVGVLLGHIPLNNATTTPPGNSYAEYLVWGTNSAGVRQVSPMTNYFGYSPLTVHQPSGSENLGSGAPTTAAPLSVILETLDSNNNWIPYQIVPDFQPEAMWCEANNYGNSTVQVSGQENSANGFQGAIGPFVSGGLNYAAGQDYMFSHPDPRTMRFGLMSAYGGGTGGGVSGGTALSVNGQGMMENAGELVSERAAVVNVNGPSGTGFEFLPIFSSDPPVVNGSQGCPVVLADYAYNLDPLSADTPYYANAAPTTGNQVLHSYPDSDGVYRKGDFNPTTAETAGPEYHLQDSPYSTPNTTAASRGTNACPIILNRPFTSVAEMGYAYRDDPWRSLDFSSKYSADGGLLDLFCLHQNFNSLRAGVVDLNGASAPVMQALLTGAYQDPTYPLPSSSLYIPLTTSQASTLATAIQGQLGSHSNPSFVLKNAADIPTLVSLIPATSFPSTYKYQREAVSRSLADVANSRTWNIMIDVIAQAGRYTSASKTVNDFNVEGERRYWVHLAIDRLTGIVVASQIEPVSE